MDRFTVSSAPSAAVFAACRRRPCHGASGSLVMAAPDHRAPRIGEEAREVAALLGDARLLLGDDASADAFRQAAPSARIVHLAAHGEFRRDNPAFSSLRLAGGGLGVLDLQEMDLGMDLLTLSGCNTGSSVPVGADELQGLLRGFLTAGARSVVAALWEIDDASAREFMRVFYRQIRSGARLPAALRQAMSELRDRYPHPYYWAPYVLIGDPEAL
jgi:CHAT domain-containing protein